jgi:predicted phage terminase large subunit-like protein
MMSSGYTYREHRPTRIFIEDTSAGTPIAQTLRKETRLPVIPCPVKGSKNARADAVSVQWETGRIFLSRFAPWVDAYIDEHCAFPGRHDDMIDATALAVEMLMRLDADRKYTASLYNQVANFGR